MTNQERLRRQKFIFKLANESYSISDISRAFSIDPSTVYSDLNNERDEYIKKDEWDEDGMGFPANDWHELRSLSLTSKIKALKKVIGLKQTEIAKLFGISQSYVSLLSQNDNFLSNTGIVVKLTSSVLDMKNKPIEPGNYNLYVMGSELAGMSELDFDGKEIDKKTQFIDFHRLKNKCDLISPYLIELPTPILV